MFDIINRFVLIDILKIYELFVIYDINFIKMDILFFMISLYFFIIILTNLIQHIKFIFFVCFFLLQYLTDPVLPGLFYKQPQNSLID